MKKKFEIPFWECVRHYANEFLFSLILNAIWKTRVCEEEGLGPRALRVLVWWIRFRLWWDLEWGLVLDVDVGFSFLEIRSVFFTRFSNEDFFSSGCSDPSVKVFPLRRNEFLSLHTIHKFFQKRKSYMLIFTWFAKSF